MNIADFIAKAMTQYQCNVCGRMFETFNDAALCHPDVNVFEDIRQVPQSGGCENGEYVVLSGGNICVICNENINHKKGKS